MKNTQESTWIMDSTVTILKETISRQLSLIDDIQQTLTDMGIGCAELDNLYNELESYSNKFEKHNTASLEDRNSVRMTCKHLIKAYSHLN